MAKADTDERMRRKKKSELSDADVKQMKRVTSYVKRHRKQRPSTSPTRGGASR